MRRSLIVLCLLWVAVPVWAAAPQWLERMAPGVDSVAADPVEYRKVVDKFAAGIVRPTIGDSATVYYGSPMQEGFTTELPGQEDMQRAIMADDYETAYALGMEILKLAPVNLTALYWTLFAATETNRPWEVRNYLRGCYNSISMVISLSGDGTSSESALRVVWPGDMYTYTMIELGLDVGQGYLWDGRWTELEVSPAGPDARYGGESIFFEQWEGR
jgi:hypothetical protein